MIKIYVVIVVVEKKMSYINSHKKLCLTKKIRNK